MDIDLVHVVGSAVVLVGAYGSWLAYKKFSPLLRMAFKLSTTLEQPDKRSVEVRDGRCHIIYGTQTDVHNIVVPFDACKVANMASFRATLLTKTGEIDITQSPGIPYMFSARELCGQHIRMTNTMTGQTHMYTHAPEYADEIAFEE